MKYFRLLFILSVSFVATFSFPGEISGRFAPPEGKVLVLIGQDNASVGGSASYRDGYVENVGTPGGVSHYIHFSEGWTSPYGFEFKDGAIPGLSYEADWGAGPMDLKAYLESPMLDRCVIHLSISFAGNSEESVADGEFDHLIVELTELIAAHQEHPFLIRIGHELGLPGNRYDPAGFRKSFRRIVDALRVDKLPNFAIVYAAGSEVKAGQFEEYDPGSEYYDWIGYSWWGEENNGRYALEFARKVEKPVIITEATPRGQDFEVADPADLWEGWFKKFFDHIENNTDVIRAISYINCDWESQDMWEGWGQTRIESSPDLLQLWREKMNLPMYLNSVDKPYSHIGFPAPYAEPEKATVEPYSLYKDPESPVEKRVEDLVGKMTLDEKIAQLTGWWDRDEHKLRREGEIFDREFYLGRAPYGIGVIGPTNLNIEEDIRQHSALQEFATRDTRLGIPPLRYAEATHGVVRIGATSFPSPIALSCSWNPGLIEKVYSQIGREAASRGIYQVLSPNISVAGDLRWGQLDETLGEDPFLTGRLGTAMVQGLQGSNTGVIAPGHVAATVKYFAGSGYGIGGRDGAPYSGGKRQLLESEVAPFRYLVKNAKPAALIPASNTIEGVPGTINSWLLNDVLRRDLEYRGLIIGDSGAIPTIRNLHKIGNSDEEVATLAMDAGVQLELPGNEGFQHLAALVEKRDISRTQIESAVKAVLDLKFRLGLFETPTLSYAEATELTTAESNRELVLEAARQSIVLLKNNGILPLDPANIGKIAVIGPNSDVCRLGSSSGSPRQSVSLLDGIRAYFLDGEIEVLHAKGCLIALNDTQDSYLNWRHVNDVNFVSVEHNLPLIEEAVEVANEADVVVLALGSNALLERKTRSGGHLGDRATLNLTDSQIKLAEEVLKTGKPVILYLSNGRPVTLGHLAGKCEAILTGHYNGQETGIAATEVLFGRTNPSGKLTVSWPHSVSQLPVHYNQAASARLHDYIDTPASAEYPFGFGLSYTRFEYSEPTLSKDSIHEDGIVEVSFEVTNTGSRAGAEVAQLYVSGEGFPVARPALELKGFQRVTLAVGESRQVTIKLFADDLYFYNSDLKRVLPKGRYGIRVGGSSVNLSEPVYLETSPREDETPLPTYTENHPGKPNILFIAIDDLRPEAGAYGSMVKTPHIDRLAADGVRFDRAYCQQAVDGASRLSVMSGLYPAATGERSFHISGWRKRHPDLLTINQHFGNSGYHTVGLGKIYYETSGRDADAANWKEWVELNAPEYVTLESFEALKKAFENGAGDEFEPPRGPTTEMADVSDDTYLDGKRALKASEMISQLAGDPSRPFFMALGFSKPHLPFVAPRKYWDLYDRHQFAMPSNGGIPPGYPLFAARQGNDEIRKYSDFEGQSPLDFSDEMNRRLLHGYAAATSYVDACLGKVMESLHQSGLAENTIVVLWGDNGWKLGDHSGWCKDSNFECDTRVPLIIKVPGEKAESGARNQLVELVDLYPTLCDLAGIEIPAHCQGKSFQHLLGDSEASHRPDAYSSNPSGKQAIGHSLRTDRCRYTEWHDKSGDVTHRVLTDLDSDPGEESNVIDDFRYTAELKEATLRLKERIQEAIPVPEAVTEEKVEERFPLEMTVELDLHPDFLRQSIDGFGGSIAFWGTHADDEALNTAINGLSANILRAQGEVSPEGDPEHNREVLERVMKINPKLEVLLTFWQPRSDRRTSREYWLREVESDGAFEYELKPERETAWAIEIATRTRQYIDWGINVTAVSVQNEANWSHPDTQTCRWDPERLAAFIESRLQPGFNAMGLDDVKIVAPDLAFIGPRASEIDRFIPALTTRTVDIISYHMYDSFNDEMSETEIEVLEQNNRALSSLRRQHFPEKRLWMTETTGSQWNSSDWHTYGWRPDLTEHEKAIKAARYIHTTLVDAEANAFLWWGLVYSTAPKGEVDTNVITKHRDEGLVLVEEEQIDGRQPFFERTRKFYTFRQYSGFVKPGYRRVQIESPEPLKLSAFLSPDKTIAVVAAVNDSPREVTLTIPPPEGMKLIGTFQTDRERDCGPVDVSTPLPDLSVRTMIFGR